jgi:hypothetical protein
VVRFEDGGVEVGGGRPRRAQHEPGPARRLGGPEGEECSGALVEVHVHAHALVGGEGEGQRRRP